MKEKKVFIAAIVLVVLVVIIIFALRKERQPERQFEPEVKGPTTEGILKSLTAPSNLDVRELTTEEKAQIIQSLTAPTQK